MMMALAVDPFSKRWRADVRSQRALGIAVRGQDRTQRWLNASAGTQDECEWKMEWEKAGRMVGGFAVAMWWWRRSSSKHGLARPSVDWPRGRGAL